MSTNNKRRPRIVVHSISWLTFVLLMQWFMRPEFLIAETTPLPDLAINLQVNPAIVAPGEAAELTITIHNQGEVAVENYIFALSLENDLTLVGAIQDETENPAGAVANQINLASLAVSATRQFSADLLMSASATEEQTIQIQTISPPGSQLMTAVATLWLEIAEPENGLDTPAIPDGLEPSLWTFRPNAPTPSFFSGAATYNYPIETPPARGGIGPSLSLSYSSRSVDGKAGWFDSNPYGEGWSLNGIPFITRQDPHYCPQNGDYDICFSGSMKLYLDGAGYTLAATGSCGANCNLYLAENAPQLRVEHYTTGPVTDLESSWLVRTPDGNRYHFGSWEDSQIGRAHV